MYEVCQAAVDLSKKKQISQSQQTRLLSFAGALIFHSATQYWYTHRFHRMRRGTPFTQSWFMPALSTQRFATVLTHPLTCINHAEYHYYVTVYQSDVKSELQSVCKENLKFTGFTLFSLTHTSIDMLDHAENHYCVTVHGSDVQSELQNVCNITTNMGFNFFQFI